MHEAEALRRAAAAVDRAAAVRAWAAALAQEQWRGPTRDRFDADLAVVQREAAALADDLRLAAAALDRSG